MNGQSVDERVRNTLLWTLNSKWGPPRALDLHHGVRRVWSPFTGKLGQFPPPCASGGRREGAHLQHPNFSDLSFLPGLQPRAEVPRRGEVGGAVIAPGTSQRLPSPPCGCVPFLGDARWARAAGAGKGRLGAGRSVYIAAKRGWELTPACGTPGGQRLPAPPPPFQRLPGHRGSPRRGALGTALPAVPCALLCALRGDLPGLRKGRGPRGRFPEVSAEPAVSRTDQSQN